MDDLSSGPTQLSPQPAEGPRRAHAGLVPGARVGPYVVERLIAEGGSARVYRARDETLARTVALKVLDHAASDWQARFLREVQLVAGLAHPHIVSLYAAGEHDGLAYAAMELLPGSLADELARRGRLPWDEVLVAATEACLGLDAAWKKGIVHRDIKPSNLLRDTSGAIKVADFGLAKDLASDLELTLEGMVLGTPWYISPEQGCGRATDLRSDLYSLGATMFHLIAGRPPYQAATPFAVIVRHAVEPTPGLGDDVPARVTALVQRLLQKNPAERPQSYGEAIELLKGVRDAMDDALVPPTPAPARRAAGDALAMSQLAAARAALAMGRLSRARDLFEQLYRNRGSVWTEAGLELASVLTRANDPAAARAVLEAVSADAPDANTRALGLWTLGTLAESDSQAALLRAADAYARVLEISDTLFPKTLLEARINKLRAKARGGSL